MIVGSVKGLPQAVHLLRIEFDESWLSLRRVSLGAEDAVDPEKEQDGNRCENQQTSNSLVHSPLQAAPGHSVELDDKILGARVMHDNRRG